MSTRKRAVGGRLEEKADSFLKAVPSPPTPRRLEEYGLQRVYARAQAGERARARVLERNSQRNPALLRRVALVALAILVIMALGTGGAYAMSYGAQPDSALYGTKIFFERARVALNPSASGDARLEMGFCDRRMKELERMYEKGSGEGAERWLREYRRNIEGVRSSIDSLPQEEMEALYLSYQEALERQAGAMRRMRGGGPAASLEGSIEEAYRVCEMERERVRMRCGQGGEGQPGDGCEGGMGGEGAQTSGDSTREGQQQGGAGEGEGSQLQYDSGAGEGQQAQQSPQPEGASPCQEGGANQDAPGGSTQTPVNDSPAQAYGTASGVQACGAGDDAATGVYPMTDARQRRLCP